MDAKAEQQWTVEETNCLLAVWSLAAVQNGLEEASKTLEHTQRLCLKSVQVLTGPRRRGKANWFVKG